MRAAEWSSVILGGLSLGGSLGAGSGLLPGGLGAGLAVGGALSLGAMVGLGSARPDLQIFGPSVLQARVPGRLVLSIDDGPHPTSTPLFLQALAEAGVRATFFVLVDRALACPDLLWAMLAGGHEIGLHGLTHSARITWKNPQDSANELRRALKLLSQYGTPPVRWYRPPFGAVSPRMYQALQIVGLEMVWCSVRTGDGVTIPVERLRRRAEAAGDRDIVLLHDGEGPAAKLLPSLLQTWAARGLQVGTVGEGLGVAA
ncbi:MAG TPA: polysaccharide deacetylase family protein [Myxococcota bacterium]|nr:polysaccharide deacetylase family protein [Myxococcota bacterium]